MQLAYPSICSFLILKALRAEYMFCLMFIGRRKSKLYIFKQINNISLYTRFTLRAFFFLVLTSLRVIYEGVLLALVLAAACRFLTPQL